MANANTSTVLYIDTGSSSITTEPTKVIGIIYTATAATASFILQENSNSKETKFRLDLADANTTDYIDLSTTPILFHNGVYAATITDGVITLIYERS